MKPLFMMMLLLASGSSAGAQSVAERLNDYPTSARADYVFGCMAANGQGQDVLIKCSCSIDHIATILPYEKYVEAETVLSLRLAGGERMAIFRTAASANVLVADLRRAQAEAEILCF
jgi:lysyl-tRNA synthetase class II